MILVAIGRAGRVVFSVDGGRAVVLVPVAEPGSASHLEPAGPCNTTSCLNSTVFLVSHWMSYVSGFETGLSLVNSLLCLQATGQVIMEFIPTHICNSNYYR